MSLVPVKKKKITAMSYAKKASVRLNILGWKRTGISRRIWS